MHNRFHRGECITWASGGEGALDTPGPLNDIERSECHLEVQRVETKRVGTSRGSGGHEGPKPRGSVAWTVRTQEPQRVETSINPMLRIRQDI